MPKDIFQKSKDIQNDEFYTLYEDIESEVEHYWPQLEGKKIWCNCNDDESNFFNYFTEQKKYHNFEVKFTGYYADSGVGDFRDPDQWELWEWADVIITNPPFTLFRMFMTLLTRYDKQFLIVAPQNAISYKEIFKLIKDNKVRLGYNAKLTGLLTYDKKLTRKDNLVNSCTWLTNLNVDVQQKQKVELCSWEDGKFPKYENYDAYETVWTYGIPRIKNAEIPYTDKILGVPISFLHRWDPDQFEIVAGCPMEFTPTSIKKQVQLFGTHKDRVLSNCAWGTGQVYIKVDKKFGKYKAIDKEEYYAVPYARILIKLKDYK